MNTTSSHWRGRTLFRPDGTCPLVAFETGSELPAYCLASLPGLGAGFRRAPSGSYRGLDCCKVAGTKRSFVGKCFPNLEIGNEEGCATRAAGHGVWARGESGLGRDGAHPSSLDDAIVWRDAPCRVPVPNFIEPSPYSHLESNVEGLRCVMTCYTCTRGAAAELYPCCILTVSSLYPLTGTPIRRQNHGAKSFTPLNPWQVSRW